MPTFEFQQPKFTEGVLAKSLHGRSPEEFYSYGVGDAENMIPLLEGPMIKRPGTLYISESQTAVSRLIPFFKGGTDAYVIEIGFDESAADTVIACTGANASTTVSMSSTSALSVGQHLFGDGVDNATSMAISNVDNNSGELRFHTTASHGLVGNDRIRFTTSGTLPTGISADTNYYVRDETANTFQVATEPNTGVGGAIDWTDAGSGTTDHTWTTIIPYPNSDTSSVITAISSNGTDITISNALTATVAGTISFSNKPYIRIFSQDKLLGVAGAVTTPYVIKSHRWFTNTANSINEIDNLSWTQSGDVIFFTCPTRKPFLLSRTIATTGTRAEDNSVWTISDYVQEDGPYENPNADPDKSLVALESVNNSLEVNDEIAYVQFDPTNNVVVLANHGLQVGQKINLFVNALTDNTQIIVKKGIAAGTDACLGGYLVSGGGVLVQDNYFYVVYATAVSFQISDSPNGPAFDIGYHDKDTASPPTPGDQFTGNIKLFRRVYERNSSIKLDSKYRTSTNPDVWATSTENNGGLLFTPDDVGRHIRINPIADTTTRRGGIRWAWGKITVIDSISRATVKLETDCSVYADDGYDPVGTTPASAGAGSSEWRRGSFNGYWDYATISNGFSGNGYPNVSQIYQQRLCFAATSVEPSTVWLSRTGNFYNFAPTELGVQDSPLVLTSGVTTEVISASNGLYFTIDSDTLDEILWLLDSKRLALGTSAGVYFLYGSETNLTVTPQRFTINRETSYSATNVDPVVVSNVIIYPQRGGREIQELEFSGSEDQWLQTRISMKAYDIISTSNITKLAWQERPNPIIWMIMDNGKVLSLSYDRQVKFKAWSVHSFGGTDTKVDDIAIIPKTDYDQVWFKVSRTINSVSKSYIEVLTRFPSENVTTRNELTFLDCAKIHKTSDIMSVVPIVNGGSQTGNTLVVDGTTEVPPTGTRFVIAGDTTIYETIAGSSATTWNLDRNLTSSPADDAVIELRLEVLDVTHLDGESVGLCTNGMEHSNKTVASNNVTLDHQLSTTAVSGLFYNASMTTLNPPTLDNQYNWNKRLLTLTALIQESLGIRIEYNDLTEELLFRSTQQNTGEPISLFTGFRKQTLSGIGWDVHTVKINSISPLPMQINGLSIELETGGP
tara:strand:+ start:2040 stop:5429 length:3390 start_codon:yes stop_codon:yes gene_type:complete